MHLTLDSSVGRAEDCSRNIEQISLGHWFESGSRDYFSYNTDNSIITGNLTNYVLY